MDTSRQVTEGIPSKSELLGGGPAAAAQYRGETADCRRDVGGRRVGGAGSAGAWHQREPGIWLASALPGRKTWGAQAGHEVAAGSGEREFAGASVGGARGRRLSESHSRARFTLNCGRRRCASKAAPIRRWCACCWSAYGDDRAADEHARLDCRRE